MYKKGDLLAPDGDMSRVFSFICDSQIEDGVTYRVVNEMDVYMWKKYADSDFREIGNVHKFMSEGNKIAGDHGKARTAEVNGFQKKMSDGRSKV